MKTLSCTLLLLALLHSLAWSEIDRVTIQWESASCRGLCPKTLEQQLKNISGVKDVTVDPAGQAVITWKPNTPLLLTSLKSALRKAKLPMNAVRVDVRGMVRHSGKSMFIVSDGDNTRFELVSAAEMATPNTNAHVLGFKLDPEIFKRLRAAEAQRLKVAIQGPLFRPEQMANPPQLIVERLLQN